MYYFKLFLSPAFLSSLSSPSSPPHSTYLYLFVPLLSPPLLFSTYLSLSLSLSLSFTTVNQQRLFAVSHLTQSTHPIQIVSPA